MTECEHCRRGTRRPIRTYWGQTICPYCCGARADYFDRNRNWPQPPWETT